MRSSGWKVLLVGVALIAMAGSQASAQNHVGVPDNATSVFIDTRNEPDGDILQATGIATAYNNLQAPTNLLFALNIQERADIGGPGTGLTQLGTVIGVAYEPDRVRRAFDRTKVNQTDNAGVVAIAQRIITVGGITATITTFGPGSNSSASGCESRATLKDAADNPPLGDYICVGGGLCSPGDDVFGTATFKTICDNAGLASLVGLPSAGQDVIRAVFPPQAGETGFRAVAKNLPNIAN